jgi:hypothetical protein
MKMFWKVKLIVALAICFSFSTVLPAQESSGPYPTEQPKCAEIHAMVGMAKARSTATLTAWDRKAGDSYRAKVAFAFRFFELHPRDRRAASAVLDLIPQNEEQGWIWYSFSGYLECTAESGEAGETEKEMLILAKFSWRFTHDEARAVLLVPSKMLAYVSYANTSDGNPSSDYAVQMRKVCLAKHQEFVKAVDQLSADDKKWFLSSTFNPDGCHVLHFPEP